MKGFTRQQNRLNYKLKQGFSLIELMITMSLSTILMLGVYNIFAIQQHGLELIGALNDREDNAQLAIKILTDGIRMADHWGGVDARQVTLLNGSLSSAPGACDTNWVFKVDNGIFGIEGGSSVQGLTGLPSQCLKTNNYLKGSDLLALRFGDSRDLFYESKIDNKRYLKHYFLRAQSGKNAILFQGNQLALAIQKLPDNGFHYNMLFHSSLYFLRPCQKNSTSCLEDSSVLTRLTLKGDRYIQEALVEGIEQMHFEYGVDDNQDNSIDHYLIASKVSDWQSVLSVRIFILVRSRLQDKSLDEKGKVYVMNSSAEQTDNSYQVPGNVRHFPRKLYRSEVSLRNRVVN